MIETVFFILALYDPAPGIYTLDYDGYGYADYLHNSSAAVADRLMDTLVLASAQFGMKVLKIKTAPGYCKIDVTGAIFEIRPGDGRIDIYQRLPRKRTLARIIFTSARLAGLTLVKQTDGFVYLRNDDVTIRINADGILMIKTAHPSAISIAPRFVPDYRGSSAAATDCLMLDETGGLGLHLFNRPLPPGSTSSILVPLGADEIIWLNICPPRVYESRKRHRIIFYRGEGEIWSPLYPRTEEFLRWRGINIDSLTFRGIDGRWGVNPDHDRFGDIVALTFELGLWKSWHVAYEPVPGWKSLTDLIAVAHSYRTRVIVYVSPSQFYFGSRYYIPGSDYYLGDHHRPRLLFSAHAGQEWPPGNPEGENVEYFLSAFSAVIRNTKFNDTMSVDGFYIDGLYFLNVPQAYYLLRRMREIVGEKRLLCLHSAPQPGGDGYLPQIDAYADYVLKGEGGRDHYGDPRYYAFFIRSKNISNAFGIFINQRDESGNYQLLDQGSLNARLKKYDLDVEFDSPLMDLASRWDSLRNWRQYYRQANSLWQSLHH
jgi:hypothetical protein